MKFPKFFFHGVALHSLCAFSWALAKNGPKYESILFYVMAATGLATFMLVGFIEHKNIDDRMRMVFAAAAIIGGNMILSYAIGSIVVSLMGW